MGNEYERMEDRVFASMKRRRRSQLTTERNKVMRRIQILRRHYYKRGDMRGRNSAYRVQQGHRCVQIFNSLLWSNHIHINTKLIIYKTILQPILTYGSEF